MSIFYAIEEIDDTKGCFDFIKGLIEWQQSYIYESKLSEKCLYFLGYVFDRDILETEAYIIEETIYKGLICNPNSIEQLKYSSFTRDINIAKQFANHKMHDSFEKEEISKGFKRIIVSKTDVGICLNKVIIDSIYWLRLNKDIVMELYGLTDLNEAEFQEEIDSWFFSENEIITSFETKKIQIISEREMKDIVH